MVCFLVQGNVDEKLRNGEEEKNRQMSVPPMAGHTHRQQVKVKKKRCRVRIWKFQTRGVDLPYALRLKGSKVNLVQPKCSDIPLKLIRIACENKGAKLWGGGREG